MNCWAENLSDCGGKVSREHYVSKGVFDEAIVTAAGLEWCKGRKVRVGLASAVARILCEKHNSALSEFDSAAGELSKYLLGQIRDNPEGRSHFNVNGWHLEKWALKTAINLAYLGAFGSSGSIPTLKHLSILFRDEPVPDGMGLYLVGGKLDSRVARAGVHWIDIRDSHTSELVAVKLTLNGVQFLACLVPERADVKTFTDKELSNAELSYRPTRFVLEGLGRAGRKTISLDWR